MCILSFRTHADRIQMALEDLRERAARSQGNKSGPRTAISWA